MKKILRSRNTGLILVLIILLIAAKILTPGLFSTYMIINTLQNNAIYAILAVG